MSFNYSVYSKCMRTDLGHVALIDHRFEHMKPVSLCFQWKQFLRLYRFTNH